MYADTVTGSMQRMMDETSRGAKSRWPTTEHNISPTTVYKTVNEVLAATAVADVKAPAMPGVSGQRCLWWPTASFVTSLPSSGRTL